MKFRFIRKRSGSIVLFDSTKIEDAIFAAARSNGGEDFSLAKQLTKKVIDHLKVVHDDSVNLTVEEVQDAIEKILIEEGHAATAKAFILYRDKQSKRRDTDELIMNIGKTIKDYTSGDDWRVNENANMGHSFGGLAHHITGSVLANYALHEIYPEEISNAHINGDLHIHDLSFPIVGYCAGWSLEDLIKLGFGGVPFKVDSRPAKHLDSLVWQMVNFIGTLQNEWAGAMAFSSFDTFLAPFIRTDNMNYKQVKQSMQAFIFNMNIPSRWSSQTPFLNVTFDWVVPDDMKDRHVLVGGKEQDFTYGDCQKEMDMINKAFIEVMIDGDVSGRIFTFPIPTYNITKDFDWDNENAELLFEMTAKYGLPYFQNFINSNLKPGDVRSMCCRLRLDLRELKNKGGGLFGSFDKTGSVGVVTINLPRIGYLSSNIDEYKDRLRYLMEFGKDSLEIKRKIVNDNIKSGFLPYTKRYLGSLKNHFSTIGIIGMNESCLNYLDTDIGSDEGKEFSIEILDYIREVLKDFQEETGHIYNLEAVPGEGCSHRLAKKDRDLYPDMLIEGDEYIQYYTNSTHLPVGYTDDIFEALDHQDDLQVKYTGGTVFHGFIGERMDPKSCKKLVKRVAENYHLPYFTISPTFSICTSCGYLEGEHETCPTCEKKCEVYSRVVGYYRPVSDWNVGKQEEFEDRKEYKIDKT